MSKNLPILSFLVTLIAIVLSVIISPNALSNPKFVLSDFGVLTSTHYIFNLGLIFSSIIYLAYLYTLFKKVKVDIKTRCILAISIIGLGLIGFIPYSVNSQLHWMSAAMFFFGYPIGMILITKNIGFTKNSLTRIYRIVLFSMLIVFPLLFIAVKPRGISEIIYMILLGISMVIMRLYAK